MLFSIYSPNEGVLSQLDLRLKTLFHFAKVQSFSSYNELLLNIKLTVEYHILYIHFEDNRDSVKLVKNITTLKNDRTKCILISQDKALAYRAWQLDVFGFAHFPVTEFFLKRQLTKYRNHLHISRGNYNYPYRSGQDNVVIDVRDLLFIKGQGNYSEFIFKSGKSDLITKKIGVLQKEFYNFDFIIRGHKSYMINLMHIYKLNYNYSKKMCNILFRNEKETKLEYNSLTLFSSLKTSLKDYYAS